jgi:hypothetical protein
LPKFGSHSFRQVVRRHGSFSRVPGFPVACHRHRGGGQGDDDLQKNILAIMHDLSKKKREGQGQFLFLFLCPYSIPYERGYQQMMDHPPVRRWALDQLMMQIAYFCTTNSLF